MNAYSDDLDNERESSYTTCETEVDRLEWQSPQMESVTRAVNIRRARSV